MKKIYYPKIVPSYNMPRERDVTQNSIALSTAEVEYIAAGSCCIQVLWIRQDLINLEISFNQTPIKCDNTSAINL